MSKGKIFTLSIILIIIVTSIILFGFVFTLKTQTVEFNSSINISQEEIIKTAGIQNGKSTLLINKNQAINNIENKYANLKVVQIKTISLFEIKFIIRERYELFYMSALNKHYILDEDLKVLRVSETEPINLVKLDMNYTFSENETACDFIGSNNQKDIIYKLFTAMYSVVINSDNAQARIDICEAINTVKLQDDNKLIITTPSNVTLDIANAKSDLQNKINICFSAINQIINDGEQLEGRTIKIFYDHNTSEYKCYISALN